MASFNGNGARNTLRGGAQADTLRGMGGADTLTGGAASDIFTFEGSLGANGVDKITDYRWRAGETDVLDLVAAIPSLAAGASIHDYVSFRAEAGGLALYVDRDGKGRAPAEKWALLEGTALGDTIQVRIGEGTISSASRPRAVHSGKNSHGSSKDFLIDTGVVTGSLAMAPGDDTGANSTDRLTNKGNPAITFTGEPGLILTLTGPSGEVLVQGKHFTVVYANGTYTVTLKDADPAATGDQPFGGRGPTATSDGTYTIKATDGTNPNNVKTIGTFAIDTTAPIEPLVDKLRTNDQTPEISGRAILGEGETLSVLVGGAVFHNVPVDPVTGVWRIDLGTATPTSGTLSPLQDGTYNVSATVTDAAGNSSFDPASGELRIDTGVETSKFEMTDATDSGDKSDDITNNGLPVLTFEGEPGLVITLNGPNGDPLTEDTGATPGHYRVNYLNGVYTVTLLDADLSNNLPISTADDFGGLPLSMTSDGEYVISAIDLTNNRAEVGRFTIDTTPPSPAPTVDLLIANSTTPILTGTALLGADEVLTITVNGQTFAPVINGTAWSLDLSSAVPIGGGTVNALVDGDVKSVTATITDKAGNQTDDATIEELRVDTSIDVSSFDMADPKDTGSSRDDEVTNNGNPVLYIEGESGLAFGIKGPNGSYLAPESNVYDGQFNVGLRQPLQSGTNYYFVNLRDAYYDAQAIGGDQSQEFFGTYNGGQLQSSVPPSGQDGIYEVFAIDQAGNIKSIGTFEIDTTPPAPPTVNAIQTKDTTPVISGEANLAPGETLNVVITGATYENVFVDPQTGAWEIDLGTATPTSGALGMNGALGDGNYAIYATVIDAAGNRSDDETQSELRIDTRVDVSGFDMASPTDTALDGDELTSNPLPVLNFFGEAGLTINLQGPDGTVLTQGVNDHYKVEYLGNEYSGQYIVRLLDADLLTSGSQGFGGPGTTATSDGTYVITAADDLGNTAAVGTFEIDTTPPATPTVNTLTTASNAPTITGTLSAPLATGEQLTVSIVGAAYNVVPSGTSWSLDLSTAVPMGYGMPITLTPGTYDVVASTADRAGNTVIDTTTGELEISQPTPLLMTQTVYYNSYETFAALGDPLAANGSVTGGAILFQYNQAVKTGTNDTDPSKFAWDFDANDINNNIMWGVGTSNIYNAAGDFTGQNSGSTAALLFTWVSTTDKTALENNPDFAGLREDTVDTRLGLTMTADGVTPAPAQSDVTITYRWKMDDAGGETFIGGSGNDWIIGGTGVDEIYGRDGDDIIDSRGGTDAMAGGAGTDTFIFAFGSADSDYVMDFEGGRFGDRIDFSGSSDVIVANSALENQYSTLSITGSPDVFQAGMNLIDDVSAATNSLADIAAKLQDWEADVEGGVVYLAMNITDMDSNSANGLQNGVSIIRYQDTNGMAFMAQSELTIVANLYGATIDGSPSTFAIWNFVGEFA